jgi:hypothetical protein
MMAGLGLAAVLGAGAVTTAHADWKDLRVNFRGWVNHTHWHGAALDPLWITWRDGQVVADALFNGAGGSVFIGDWGATADVRVRVKCPNMAVTAYTYNYDVVMDEGVVVPCPGVITYAEGSIKH